MTDYMIETAQLCCRIGRRYLLRDVNWQVERGQHYCVFGLNGCGKTTLLSVSAGFRSPTSGSVRVWGEAFTNDNILRQRQRIGWVSSSFFDKYYQKESALAIVLSGRTGSLGLDFSVTEQDVKRAKALLAALGLTEQMYQPFESMSKGERQNVLIARALLTEPELLVLDEPCSGLDVLARERTLATVRMLAESGQMTVIYVTHHTEEILDIFQDTLLLADGQVYACGKTAELFAEATLERFFRQPVQVDVSAGRLMVQVREANSALSEAWKGGERDDGAFGYVSTEL